MREDSVGRRGGPGRHGYPAELRRRVIDLLATGRQVADVARDLGISEQAIYGWRRQERIDRGLEPELSTEEQAELAAAKRRIRELEAELAVHRRDGDRRTRCPGCLPGAGRLRVRLLRVAEAVLLGSRGAACMAD